MGACANGKGSILSTNALQNPAQAARKSSPAWVFGMSMLPREYATKLQSGVVECPSFANGTLTFKGHLMLKIPDDQMAALCEILERQDIPNRPVFWHEIQTN